MRQTESFYEGRLYEIRSADVPMGAYWIVILPPETTSADQVKKEDLIPKFFGETPAEDLFAPQIVRDLTDRGNVVGILLNPRDHTTFVYTEEED